MIISNVFEDDGLQRLNMAIEIKKAMDPENEPYIIASKSTLYHLIKKMPVPDFFRTKFVEDYTYDTFEGVPIAICDAVPYGAVEVR